MFDKMHVEFMLECFPPQLGELSKLGRDLLVENVLKILLGARENPDFETSLYCIESNFIWLLMSKIK